ncbi:MAG: inner membrane-spanning protein YciB [Pseudomonadota bacterium]
MADAHAPRLKGSAKAWVDFGPVAVFVIAYFFGGTIAPILGNLIGQNWTIEEGGKMYLAIGLFMPAFAVAFAYSVYKERRIAPMLLISGVIIGVFGSLTLILKDKTFFFMKPTMVNLLFAALLFGGLLSGRTFLKSLFDDAFQMADTAWRTLTLRYGAFFVFMAVLNEIAWRYLTRECDLTGTAACPGEATWVNLKIFGFTLLTMVFTGSQLPFIMKNASQMPGRETSGD